MGYFPMDEVDRYIDRLSGIDRDEIYAATLSLCEMADCARPRLLQVLNDQHARSIVRCRVADTLGMIGDRSTTDDLIRALNDVEVRVRWHALRALAKIGAANAVPALRHLAVHDTGEFEITPTVRIVMKQEAQTAIDQIQTGAS